MQGSTPNTLLQQLQQEGLINADQRLIIETEAARIGIKPGTGFNAERYNGIATLLLESGFVEEPQLLACLESICGFKTVSLQNIIADPQALAFVDETIARRFCVFPVYYHADSRTLDLAVADPSDVLLRDKLDSLFASLYKEAGKLELHQALTDEIDKAIDSAYSHELTLESIVAELSNRGRVGNPGKSRSNHEGSGDFNTGRKGRDRSYAGDGHKYTDEMAGAGIGSNAADQLDDTEHPVVRLTNGLLLQAYRQRASDVHFEPEANYFRVRFRIDGILQTRFSLHIKHWAACATRLKVIGGLNIAETRDSQDGAFSLRLAGSQVDLRISVFPTLNGENIVLRLLDPANACLSLDDTGLDPATLNKIRTASSTPQGLFLMVGPTGCGKTTTMYSLLKYLSDESVNIMTLENPVEYRFPLIRQCSVGSGAKLGFAEGIRSILRQDPDVILVGEIRDTETAELSMRAAMTGHLVFSSLHTKSALGAVERLVDLGIDRSVVAETLTAVVSQRLLRRLCEKCKVASRASTPSMRHSNTAAPLESRPFLADEDDSEYGSGVEFIAGGCKQCANSGYYGRTAIAEVLVLTDAIREQLYRQQSSAGLRQAIEDSGFVGIHDVAEQKVRSGVTSRDEVRRVLGEPQHQPQRQPQQAQPPLQQQQQQKQQQLAGTQGIRAGTDNHLPANERCESIRAEQQQPSQGGRV